MSNKGKKLRYTTDQLGIIEELISGYSGDRAIIRELLQNAQDAGRRGGKFVEFCVYSDKMVVRNNAAPFIEKDWHSITTIASRGKKKEIEQIGAFGIGFVSVYQITDYPEIRSGGHRLVLDPMEEDDFYTELIEDSEITEFHFRYRGTDSKIGPEIGASSFGPDRVDDFLTLSVDEIYRSFLFLDTISRVSVYQNDRLVAQVEKEIHESQAGDISYKKIIVSWQRNRKKTVIHEWAVLQREFDIDDIKLPTDKRTIVSIALNLSNPKFSGLTDRIFGKL